MIDSILFDNDGVLVSSEHLYQRACREALYGRGIELTDETFRRVSLVEGKNVMLVAEAHGVSATEIAELGVIRDGLYADFLEEGVDVLDGVPEVLDELRGEFRLAIVTTCPGAHFHIQHRDLGLLELFDLVLVREDYRIAKPHPEPYLTAVERLGTHVARSVAVEDSARGFASAVAAQIPCVAIPHGPTESQEFPGALSRLSSIRELPALLRDHRDRARTERS